MYYYKQGNRENFSHKVLTNDAPFAIREAFNLLRTNLMYTMTHSDADAPIYAVTSANENAGKSTVIVNLAIAFAQLDKKVLLVDGDMRCPVVHKHFEIDSHRNGLSELISGMNDDVIIQNVCPNLDVITSGRIPPNPSELLMSPRFDMLIEKWKKEYDIIFIDFPPIGIVTDAIANCKNITGYIFVVRSGKSSAKEITSSISTLEQVGAKIVGMVLNDYNIKGADRYKRNYSRYKNKLISRYEKSAKKVNKESKNV